MTQLDQGQRGSHTASEQQSDTKIQARLTQVLTSLGERVGWGWLKGENLSKAKHLPCSCFPLGLRLKLFRPKVPPQSRHSRLVRTNQSLAPSHLSKKKVW